MNVTLTPDITGLRDLTLLLGPAKRVELGEAMGYGIREETRDYLRELAPERHDTALRLGATPTGHLSEAARAVEGSPVTADSEGGTLTINHVGMIRALRDVEIRPINAQYLSIPINALAYGRRIGEFGGKVILLFEGGHRTTSEKKRPPIPSDLPVFYLVRSVTQKQDRTLLPSDEQWERAAAEAATLWFDREIASLSA